MSILLPLLSQHSRAGDSSAAAAGHPHTHGNIWIPGRLGTAGSRALGKPAGWVASLLLESPPHSHAQCQAQERMQGSWGPGLGEQGTPRPEEMGRDWGASCPSKTAARVLSPGLRTPRMPHH